MGERARRNWMRADLIASLVVGWLIGFGIHGSAAAGSGMGDIPWDALWLGVLLCAWAGAVAWLAGPAHQRRRFGALAGLLMMGGIVLGNVAVVILWVHPPVDAGGGGETWFSLLLESWFWVGVPVLGSLGLGALGWTAADLLGHRRGTSRA